MFSLKNLARKGLIQPCYNFFSFLVTPTWWAAHHQSWPSTVSVGYGKLCASCDCSVPAENKIYLHVSSVIPESKSAISKGTIFTWPAMNTIDI